MTGVPPSVEAWADPEHPDGPRRAHLRDGTASEPERRIVHPAWSGLTIAVGMVAALVIALGTTGPLRGVAVGSATLLVPGLATLPTASARWGRAARFSWTVVVSMVVFVNLGLAMAWSHQWFPGQATIVVLVLASWTVAVRGLRPGAAPSRHPDHASGARRAAASLVDIAPLALLAGAVSATVGTGLGATVLPIAVAGALAWITAYVVTGAAGATVGMALVGLRLVDSSTGSPLGLRRFTARSGANLGLVLSLVGPVVALADRGRHAGWADTITRSTVTTRAHVMEGQVPLARPRAVLQARHLVPALILVASAATWAVTTATADVSVLGDWGLTPALGPWWFGALAAVALVLGVGVVGRLGEGWIAAHLGLLVLMLYGTPGLVEQTPRLPWAFKHIAVTRYIEANGSIDPSGDIYQRWPGMFAWTAVLGDATGYTDPLRWEVAAEIGFALLDVVLVVAIARALSPGSRWAWGAATLYAVTNWVGQNYFAPQGLAYVVWLFVALLVVLGLAAEPRRLGRWLEKMLHRRRSRTRPAETWPGPAVTRPVPASHVAAILLAFFTMVASHQLTPYMALLTLVPMFVLGYLRPFWLAVAMGVLTLGFLAPNFSFVDNKYGILSSLDFVNNATYSAVDLGALSVAETWQRRGTLAIAATIFVLGFLGLVRRLRADDTRRVLLVGWLMFSPLLVMAGQSYGGEIRLRAYLFALPWAVVAASWLVEPRDVSRRTPWARVAYPVVILALAGVFSLTYFQPATTNRTSVAAVGALEWIDAAAEPGDVVLTSGASPASIGERYTVPSYSSLTVAKQWVRDDITVEDLVDLARATDPQARRVVVIFTDRFLADPDPAPFAPGELTALYQSMLATPGATQPYSVGDAHAVVLDLQG